MPAVAYHVILVIHWTTETPALSTVLWHVARAIGLAALVIVAYRAWPVVESLFARHPRRRSARSSRPRKARE